MATRPAFTQSPAPFRMPAPPRALLELEGEALAAAQDLGTVVGDLAALGVQLEESIYRARHFGVSWGAISWLLGVTPEAARRRWAR